MFKKIKIAALAAAMTFSAGEMALAGNVPESNDPIKVIMNDWTGQLFSTEIVGGLLQEMGYNIEYVERWRASPAPWPCAGQPASADRSLDQ